jgi:hypothetical protein
MLLSPPLRRRRSPRRLLVLALPLLLAPQRHGASSK